MRSETVRDWDIPNTLRKLTDAEIKRYARSTTHPTTFKAIIRDVPLQSIKAAIHWLENDRLPLYSDALDSIDVLNLYRALAQMANAPGIVTRMDTPQIQLFLDLADTLA